MKRAIGKLIKDRLQEVGITKSELARRINCSSQNIFDVFERESIDTGMLLKISLVLNYNFFEIYYQEAQKGLSGEKSKSDVEKITFFVKDIPLKDNDSQELNYLKMRIECLEELNALLKQKWAIKPVCS